MTRAVSAMLVVMALCAVNAWSQEPQREPHIGYLSPAGGKRGTSFRVVVGGQSLRGARAVHVTGDGVNATVVRHYPPLRQISPEQRDVLTQRMAELLARRWAELAASGDEAERLPRLLAAAGFRARRPTTSMPADTRPAELPEHPLLYELENKSLRELLHVAYGLRQLRQAQRNAQIAESVLIEVSIDRDAEPGDRELRLLTGLGLSNPLPFQVGWLPEVNELELPNERLPGLLPAEPPLELPVLINGQIMPGDVDRFRFNARKGQRLVIEAYARRLVPYMADAVPGWFQATLSLRDSTGREVAFVDDYRFSPDPVLLYEVPEDSVYEVEIRDSLYRGREDFVYRLTVGECPFVTSVFPLGCRTGQQRYVKAAGWNLPTDRLFLDGQGIPGIRRKPLGRGKVRSNPISYEVADLPACEEIEPNDSSANAQAVRPPVVVDGRVDRPGDVDVFQFSGTADQEMVVEVVARRVGSPLDSLIRLTDDAGRLLAINDDYEHKDGYLHADYGLLTHAADSYLRTRLPADGTCYVHLSDAQAQGSQACAYRLRVSPPQPDFELRISPASVNVRGLSAVLHAYALRKDGFDGPIDLTLEDAPPGLALAGARIPAGRDSVRLTLSAATRSPEPVPLRLEAHATIGGKPVHRPAVPAEDLMQAFLYRHLTPAQQLMAAVAGGRRPRWTPRIASDVPVRIPAGGVAQIRISAPPGGITPPVEPELDQPPPGIRLCGVATGADGVVLEVAADAQTAPIGLQDNLIVQVFAQVERAARDANTASRVQRVSLGFLPAIPIEVVTK